VNLSPAQYQRERITVVQNPAGSLARIIGRIGSVARRLRDR
jgi:hypothetical protein